MNYRLSLAADEELQEARDYYDDCVPGLGEDFLKQVDTAIQQVLTSPEAWRKLSLNCRRYLVQRFPYGVIYQIKADHILVVSIFHLSRKPDSWRKNFNL